MTEEQKLLTNIKRQRRGSLEKAIDIYTPYVSVIVYNVIGAVMTKEDIEEVVSDVFVALWKNAANLDINKGCVRTYLGTAARNCAKNKLRTAAVHDELNENISAANYELSAAIERDEESELLLSLINELGEPDSEIFMRYYYYEEKISKISLATGLCNSTIKTKLARGRKKLKEALIQRRRCGNE